MFEALFKKKVSEEKIASYFIHTTIDVVDKGFPYVAEVIENDTSLVIQPDIVSQKSDKLLLIVLAANMQIIPDHFNSYQDRRILQRCYVELSEIFQVPERKIQEVISNYQSFLKRANYPSKNTLYAMSKGVFHKYKLNECQEDYFKNMKTPNPMLLKRLDELMAQFIWDWEEYKDKYKIVE